MLTRIVGFLGTRANRPPLHEEAIWAIRLYLDEQRERSLRVTTKPSPVQSAAQNCHILCARGITKQKTTLVAVIDISASCVLAFRGNFPNPSRKWAVLSFYDALVAARCPHPYGAGGLVWEVPTCLLTTETPPQTCERACALLSVKCDSCTRSTVPLIEDLAMYWRDLHAQGPIPVTTCWANA